MPLALSEDFYFSLFYIEVKSSIKVGKQLTENLFMFCVSGLGSDNRFCGSNKEKTVCIVLCVCIDIKLTGLF